MVHSNNQNGNLDAILQKYKDQLIQYQARSASNTPPISMISPKPLNETPYTITENTAPILNEEIAPTLQSLQGIGGIKVVAYTAKGAVPIPNAHVTISRKTDTTNELIKLSKTNESGETPIISVPTVKKDFSEHPGSMINYVPYDIRIDKDGYFIFDTLNVPVYDGVTALQQVELIPLPENYKGDRMQIFMQSGPTTL